MSVPSTITADIYDSLSHLDAKLLRMAQAMCAQTGQDAGADPFRGLYISEKDVFRLLDDAKPEKMGGDSLAQTLRPGSRWDRLGHIYKLSSFELDVLLVALALEIDLRYERIFAYLQDDVSRKRPSIDLILNLLCSTPAEKLAKRAVFGASGSLVSNRLIHISREESIPLLRHEVCIDSQIVSFLLEDAGIDGRLTPFVSVIDPEVVAAGSACRPLDAGLLNLAHAAQDTRSPLVVYFRGTDEETKRRAAVALRAELNAPLLIAAIDRASRHASDFEDWLRDLEREAMFRAAVVYLEGMEALSEEARANLLRTLPAFGGITIVSGMQEWRSRTSGVDGVITISFETLGWRDCRLAWKAALCAHSMEPGGRELDPLTECFRFTASQIADAASTAARLAKYRGQRMSMKHVFEAARARSGAEMGNFARRVAAIHGWDDIVLPQDAITQLREICRRVVFRHHVLDRWGFGRKLSSGKGVNALFHGYSGTGKTMAAEVIARELQLDLYTIDLAGVVSKYIGETEKNLDRIFAAAANANAILFFDEADALFGKRSEVRDSHDRYANLEISYLLQKMEQYDGIAILATNLKQNLDDAFVRRLAFSVHFPFPDDASRRRIWNGIWPKETPLSADVNFEWLAVRFQLSGGHIRNIALAAAFLAIEDNGPVNMSHVLSAVRAEFQKMGKTFTAAELETPLPAASGAIA